MFLRSMITESANLPSHVGKPRTFLNCHMLLSNTVSISLRAKIEQLRGILVDIVRFVLSASGTMLLLPLALSFSVSSASRNSV
jgi:hypothetical protein